MPEVLFDVRWPDGSDARFYSPSLIVEEYLPVGSRLPLTEFVRRAREALGIASARVEAKFGFPCSLAAGSLAAIEQAAAEQTALGYGEGGEVVLTAFHR